MNIKGFDYKAFAVTHGEKVALGVVGLLAVVVLISGIKQGTYTKTTPKKLEEEAQTARTTIAATDWPPAEQEKYPAHDRLGLKITKMLTPIHGDRLLTNDGPGYAQSISSTFPLYVREKPLTDPDYLPVQKVIATYFSPVIANRSETSLDGEATGDEEGVDGTTRLRKPTGGLKPAGGAGGETGCEEDETTDGETPENEEVEDPESLYDTGVEAEGRRAVAVRGIVPIREQVRAFEKALNLEEGRYDPLQLVQYHDFILERRMSSDGGKTWSKWQEVDKTANVEYLRTQVSDFETDVVEQRILHYIFSSPLPMRLLSYWGPEATHPDIEGYNLTPEAKKRQEAIQQAIAEERERLEKERGPQPGGFSDVRPGGFGDVQYNMQRERFAVMEDSGSRERFWQTIRKLLPGADETEMRNLINQVKAEVTAAGDLLLFRYFDFDVIPGMTYKYRVRLVIRNPLFGTPVEKLSLDSRESNKTRFRETPPSNETAPVHVPKDAQVFIANVTQEHRTSPRVLPPQVDMEIFQWFPELGTTVKGGISNVKPGQRIEGTDGNTKRYDPAKGVLFINVPSEFKTSDVLLDVETVESAIRDLDNHLDELGLPRSFKGQINLSNQILIVDQTGRVQRLDPQSTKSRYKRLDRMYQTLVTTYEKTAVDPNAVQTDEEGGEGGCLDEPIEEGEGNYQRRRTRPTIRRRNKPSPLRRTRRTTGGCIDS